MLPPESAELGALSKEALARARDVAHSDPSMLDEWRAVCAQLPDLQNTF
jgi:hypothetical protein